MFFLHLCLFAMHVPGSCAGQKKASDPLEQKLHVTVSHCMSAGNQIWVVCKSSQCS